MGQTGRDADDHYFLRL